MASSHHFSSLPVCAFCLVPHPDPAPLHLLISSVFPTGFVLAPGGEEEKRKRAPSKHASPLKRGLRAGGKGLFLPCLCLYLVVAPLGALYSIFGKSMIGMGQALHSLGSVCLPPCFLENNNRSCFPSCLPACCPDLQWNMVAWHERLEKEQSHTWRGSMCLGRPPALPITPALKPPISYSIPLSPH